MLRDYFTGRAWRRFFGRDAPIFRNIRDVPLRYFLLDRREEYIPLNQERTGDESPLEKKADFNPHE